MVNLTHPHIMTLPSLLEYIAPLRASGKKMVFTNGCFDIIHPGHVDLLERAKAQGDFLILGLNSDSSVRRQNKGPERPINSFMARAFVLAHLASVDAIVEFDEDTPYNLIRSIIPDVLIKGGDWTPDRIVGRDIVEAHGGKVLSLPLIDGYSTTSIIKKIMEKA